MGLFLRQIQDYFSFTKGEKNAMVFLLILMLMLSVLLYFTNEIKADENIDVVDLIAKINLLESKNNQPIDFEKFKDSIKHFNPNTVGEDFLVNCGLKQHLAKRIIAYRNSGRNFKIKSDLLKIYGMDSFWYKRVYSKLDLPEKKETYQSKLHDRKNKIKYLIEINSADTNDLIALPGIASKLAGRIVNFRDKLGGFYSLNQMKEVYGLNPETLELILPKLTIDPNFIKTIDINQIDEKTLAQHPYCGFKCSRMLINFRNQHGKYKNCEDFNLIAALNSDKIPQLCHYLEFK